jgi:hypothetical protein
VEVVIPSSNPYCDAETFTGTVRVADDGNFLVHRQKGDAPWVVFENEVTGTLHAFAVGQTNVFDVKMVGDAETMDAVATSDDNEREVVDGERCVVCHGAAADERKDEGGKQEEEEDEGGKQEEEDEPPRVFMSIDETMERAAALLAKKRELDEMREAVIASSEKARDLLGNAVFKLRSFRSAVASVIATKEETVANLTRLIKEMRVAEKEIVLIQGGSDAEGDAAAEAAVAERVSNLKEMEALDILADVITEEKRRSLADGDKAEEDAVVDAAAKTEAPVAKKKTPGGAAAATRVLYRIPVDGHPIYTKTRHIIGYTRGDHGSLKVAVSLFAEWPSLVEGVSAPVDTSFDYVARNWYGVLTLPYMKRQALWVENEDFGGEKKRNFANDVKRAFFNRVSDVPSADVTPSAGSPILPPSYVLNRLSNMKGIGYDSNVNRSSARYPYVFTEGFDDFFLRRKLTGMLYAIIDYRIYAAVNIVGDSQCFWPAHDDPLDPEQRGVYVPVVFDPATHKVTRMTIPRLPPGATNFLEDLFSP